MHKVVVSEIGRYDAGAEGSLTSFLNGMIVACDQTGTSRYEVSRSNHNKKGKKNFKATLMFKWPKS